MKLYHPFKISARLVPALQIGNAWISYDQGEFVIDLPDGSEHVVKDFHPPASGWYNLQSQFAALLGFLGACAESRNYAERNGKNPMDGEHSDLFPDNVGTWAQENSDEIDMLSVELEESTENLIEDYKDPNTPYHIYCTVESNPMFPINVQGLPCTVRLSANEAADLVSALVRALAHMTKGEEKSK